MRIHNSFNTYQLLRNSAPTFLQIVYTDSTLWPNPHGPPAVSLPYVLSSTRYELGHFVMIDILCSMAYGLPQVVDYDTSASASRAIIHPIEWVHGCPSEFLYCLADMNFRCANNYIAHDWHLIERRLLSFKPSLFQMEALESWKTVARLAVIESWRQVLLIYLYMVRRPPYSFVSELIPPRYRLFVGSPLMMSGSSQRYGKYFSSLEL
jgi:hypothetical protein